VSFARPVRSQMRVRQALKDFALSSVVVVLATFEFDEPMIFGFGATEQECWEMVPSKHPQLSICHRVPATTELVWRDALGREVHSEHFRYEVS
jgi:hypothetical protein